MLYINSKLFFVCIYCIEMIEFLQKAEAVFRMKFKNCIGSRAAPFRQNADFAKTACNLAYFMFIA